MAAPSGTIWGDITDGSSNGRKGRLGIYTSVSNTDTQTTVNIQVWFWTIYSCTDGGAYPSQNYLYFDVGTGVSSATTHVNPNTCISIQHTVATGEGWNTANQTRIYNITNTYNRGTSAATYKAYAKFSGIDMLNGPSYVNTSFTVPALASYTISYNANGGSGAPSSQTKYYGRNISISSTKPTRTGHTFQGWGTSSGDTSVDYEPGATYSGNANATLYAIWKANTYAVKFNANGGTGAPSQQTKTYGVTLKLSSTEPTRDRYNFLGWATSATATSATYSAGGNYTANAAVTLYAVWELAYIKPRISGVSINRCDSAGVLDEAGTYASVSFTWVSDLDSATIAVLYSDGNGWIGTSDVVESSGGTETKVIGDGLLDPEITYIVKIGVTDGIDSFEVTASLSGMLFPIDVKAGGLGVAFGKPAELEGVAEFQFDAKFNRPVYGKVLGMDKVTSIPSDSDLNDYLDPGCYAVQRNDTAETIVNIPAQRAGRLEVWSTTGEGVQTEQYSYLRQRYITYQVETYTYERDIYRGSDNVWVFDDWVRTSGTKVLHTTAAFMHGTQTSFLNEPISKQPNGIVLVFSKYVDNTAQNSNFKSFFISKESVSLHPGAGYDFTMFNGNFSIACNKYLYIFDTYISGHANNGLSGTGACGITFENTQYVLRYVIGV